MHESSQCLGDNLPLSMSAGAKCRSTSFIYFSNLFETNFDYTRQMLKFVCLAPAWINIQFIPNTNAAINICPRHTHFPIPLNHNYPTQL